MSAAPPAKVGSLSIRIIREQSGKRKPCASRHRVSSRQSLERGPASEHVEDGEHDDRADQRADETGGLSRRVPAHRLSDESGEERAHDQEYELDLRKFGVD